MKNIVNKLFVLLLMVSSCAKSSTSTLQANIKPQVNLLSLNEVAIVPFVSNQSISSTELKAIDKKLLSAFSLKTDLNIKDCSQFEINLAKVTTLEDKAKSLASDCSVQGVLYGMITKYTEKNVAFKLWIYSSKHKDIIWSATYQNSQPVLTDNLLAAGGQGLSYQNSEKIIFDGIVKAAMNLQAGRK